MAASALWGCDYTGPSSRTLQGAQILTSCRKLHALKACLWFDCLPSKPETCFLSAGLLFNLGRNFAFLIINQFRPIGNFDQSWLKHAINIRGTMQMALNISRINKNNCGSLICFILFPLASLCFAVHFVSQDCPYPCRMIPAWLQLMTKDQPRPWGDSEAVT